jgi:predicted small secreted protein
MKRVTALLALLLGVFVIAGCQNSHQTAGHHDDSACQRDLARLMNDQPGYVPPTSCDPTLVMHLEAAR